MFSGVVWNRRIGLVLFRLKTVILFKCYIPAFYGVVSGLPAECAGTRMKASCHFTNVTTWILLPHFALSQ